MRCGWLGLALVAFIGAGCTSADKSADDSSGTTESASTGGGEDGAGEDGGSGSGGDDGANGDDGGDGGGEVDWDSLNGDVPGAPVDLPAFAATHYDGSARSQTDLVGDPTVMWFYPAAGTAG